MLCNAVSLHVRSDIDIAVRKRQENRKEKLDTLFEEEGSYTYIYIAKPTVC